MELKCCPECHRVCESNHLECGVYQYWCVPCKIPFEGNHIIEMQGFTADPRFNPIDDD